MQRPLYAVAGLLISVGTVFVLLARAPEERVIVSDDSRATLSGEFSPTDELSIYSQEPLSYQLFPENKVLPSEAELTIRYHGLLSDAQAAHARLAYFDSGFGMWRPVYTLIDPETARASATIDRFGEWKLLVVEDVARPDMSQQIETLIDAAPESAVGYVIEVGYAHPPEVHVILTGMTMTGGCGGQYKTGTSTITTNVTENFSDSLEYQIVAQWQLGDGCAERQVIE